MIGKRIGRLVITRRIVSTWIAKCDCGNETTITTGQITTGKKHSCGCLKSEWRKALANRHVRLHTSPHQSKLINDYYAIVMASELGHMDPNEYVSETLDLNPVNKIKLD